jgi:hypothetical protein
MEAWILATISGDTRPTLPWITLDTVVVLTPTARATSLMVTKHSAPFGLPVLCMAIIA